MTSSITGPGNSLWKALDYIPFASSIKSAIQLIAAYGKQSEPLQDLKKWNFSRLNQGANRCRLLMIPVFGNIAIGFLDVRDVIKRNKDQRSNVEARKKEKGSYLKIASEKRITQPLPDSLKNDVEFAKAVLQRQGDALQYFSEEVQNNKDVVLVALEQEPRGSFFLNQQVDKEWLKDQNFVLNLLRAVRNDENKLVMAHIYLVDKLPQDLKTNKEFVLQTKAIDPDFLFVCASPDLYNDLDFVGEYNRWSSGPTVLLADDPAEQ